MSRSGYSDDDYYDEHGQWANIRWRGAVKAALRGKRGQAFLRETVEALDALPERKLINGALEHEGCYCTLGAVGRKRSMDMVGIHPENTEGVAFAFGLAEAMTREIVFENDEAGPRSETPEQRWYRMRRWVQMNIREAA